MKKTIKLIFTISLLNTASPAFSDEIEQQEADLGLLKYKRFLLDENGKWSVGLGAITKNSPFKGEKISVLPVPIIDYSSKNLFIRGIRGGYHIKKVKDPRQGGLFLDAYLSPRMRPGDSRGKLSLDGGISGGFQGPLGAFSLTVEQDITSASSGTMLDLSYSFTYVTPNRKQLFIPMLSISYQNQKLADYLWGIDQETYQKTLDNVKEVVLEPYNINSHVVNYNAGITHVFRIDDHWNTMINARVTLLDNKILQNPAVERQFDYSFITGFAYTF